jgi:hypothetical protein
METFPSTVKKIVDLGAEIDYMGTPTREFHQMIPEQEHDVLHKCIDVAICGFRLFQSSCIPTAVEWRISRAWQNG